MAVIRALATLLLMLTAAAAWGQEGQPEKAASTPEARALTPEWWRFIGDAGQEVQVRVDALLAHAAAAVAEAQGQREEPDPALTQSYERLRLNLEALPKLLAQAAPPPKPAPAPVEEYTLGDYLGIARELRQMRIQAEQLSQAIQRDDASIRAAARRADSLLAAYIGLPETDPQRLGRGLQIMATRSALAVARRQASLRQEQLAGLRQRIDQFTALQEHAAGAVAAAEEQLTAVDARLEELARELGKAQDTLREREARAVGMVGETPLEAAGSAWHNQQVVEAAARERGIHLEIARLQLEHIWLELALAAPEQLPLDTATKQLAQTDELLALTRSELEAWEDQSERELVALRTMAEDPLDARLRKRNQDRVQSAEESLRLVESVRGAAADVELIGTLVKKRVFAEQGVFAGGFAALWAGLAGGWTAASDLLSASLFKIGETPVTSFGLLRVGLIVFVAFWFSRLFRHGLERLGSGGEGTQSAFYSVGRLAHYLIITVAIIVGLASIGLNFSNLAIVAGALGVGIGFGLQSIVNNFVSGLILLFEQSLKVGDYVELDSGVAGIVKEINVRSTLINTNENLDVLVPNSEFVGGKLTNWTHKEASRRMHIPFGVAYGSDKELVRSAVLEAADGIRFTVKDVPGRRADVWLVGFGDSSLDFELIVWVKQASVRRPRTVRSTYNWAIESALGKYGIEIPFPQRDLHLRSGLERLYPEAGRQSGNDE